MTTRTARSRLVRGERLWLVTVLLLGVVAAPTACVLWFMTEAMANERLAARQRLIAVYRGQLGAVGQRLRDQWDQKLLALLEVDPEAPAAALFAEFVEAGVADSFVLRSSAGGPAYPGAPAFRFEPTPALPAPWVRAQRLEFVSQDHEAAAEAYALIADETENLDLAARALRSQARCLARAGREGTAVEILTRELGQERYSRSTDDQGRLIALDAQLLALQLLAEAEDPRLGRVADSLRARVADYSDGAVPDAQRRFLMRQMQSLLHDDVRFPTLAAEELAERYFLIAETASFEPVLKQSGLPGIWCLGTPTTGVQALFEEETILAEMQSLAAEHGLPDDATIRLSPPGGGATAGEEVVALDLDGPLDGWRLQMLVDDWSLFDAAADRQVVVYLWTGSLVTVVFVLLAFFGAGAIGRQLRLARLKNDLVASVSHELKTPLSSMRLLVDTLLGDDRFDELKVREYLQLIAKENARLSHLIDSFLTFSRIERRKSTDRMTEVDAASVADSALQSVADMLSAGQCQVDVEVEPDLPRIMADPDALATAVRNLLDNAFKYSGADKWIGLRVFEDAGSVCYQVRDNGLGMPRKVVKRVFDRFYQADQSLSRTSGGCGLGLSIVRSVVTDHGGSVSVDSEPGRGSTFTIRVPALTPGPAKRQRGAG